MVTEERRIEVRELLARVGAWAARRPDVVAVVLVGSWARGHATMDSDLDLVVLTAKKDLYLGDISWLRGLGGLRIVRTQERGLPPSGGSLWPPDWRSRLASRRRRGRRQIP